MINPRELRIGNILILNNPKHRPDQLGKLVEVLEIKEESATVSVLGEPFRSAFSFGQFYKFLDPVPLMVPSIKETLGFIPLNDFFKKDGYGIKWDDDTNEWFFINPRDDSGDFYEHLAWVSNVHQVQNLYFALTGKELEVKL